MSVKTKAYLLHPFGEPEIRMFELQNPKEYGFTQLQSKVQELFPSAAQRNMKLSWKDEEGDFVSMSTDEELATALAYVHEGTFNIFVRPDLSADSHRPPSFLIESLLQHLIGPAAEMFGFGCESHMRTENHQCGGKTKKQDDLKKEEQITSELQEPDASTSVEAESCSQTGVANACAQRPQSSQKRVCSTHDSEARGFCPGARMRQIGRPAHEPPSYEQLLSGLHRQLAEFSESAEDRAEYALEQMKAMGFSNEGDWLKNLIRAKNGDIGRVLEALSPAASHGVGAGH